MVDREAPIRVLVVAQAARERARLRAVLAGEGDILVVGAVAALSDLPRPLSRKGVDVALVGVRRSSALGELGGEAAKEGGGGTRTLVLVEQADDETVLSLIMRGVSGFLGWDTAPGEVCAAVRAVRDGMSPICGEVARVAADRLRERLRRENSWGALGPSEHDLLRRAARGDSDAEIGRALGIGAGAARRRLLALLHRLGARRRAQAASVLARVQEEELRRMDAWREGAPAGGAAPGTSSRRG